MKILKIIYFILKKELQLKFEGLNLYDKPYKNQELFENFDDAKSLDIKNKKKVKKTSNERKKIIKNKINDLFGY